MPEASVVQQLDRSLATPFPPILDEKAEYRAQLLPTERIVPADLLQVDDHQFGIRRDREPGHLRDRLRLLPHDLGINALTRRRNHHALERALFLGRAKVCSLTTKRVAGN